MLQHTLLPVIREPLLTSLGQHQLWSSSPWRSEQRDQHWLQVGTRSPVACRKVQSQLRKGHILSDSAFSQTPFQLKIFSALVFWHEQLWDNLKLNLGKMQLNRLKARIALERFTLSPFFPENFNWACIGLEGEIILLGKHKSYFKSTDLNSYHGKQSFDSLGPIKKRSIIWKWHICCSTQLV